MVPLGCNDTPCGSWELKVFSLHRCTPHALLLTARELSYLAVSSHRAIAPARNSRHMLSAALRLEKRRQVIGGTQSVIVLKWPLTLPCALAMSVVPVFSIVMLATVPIVHVL